MRLTVIAVLLFVTSCTKYYEPNIDSAPPNAVIQDDLEECAGEARYRKQVAKNQGYSAAEEAASFFTGGIGAYFMEKAKIERMEKINPDYNRAAEDIADECMIRKGYSLLD